MSGRGVGKIKLAERRREAVLHSPSGHDGVKAEYEDGGKDAYIPREIPWRTWPELTVGTEDVAAGLTSHTELSAYHRYPDEENKCHIAYEESASAMDAGLIWKSPYIAQPHSRAHCRCYRSETGGENRPVPAVLFLCHYMSW